MITETKAAAAARGAPRFVKLIDRMINDSGMTQRAIANALGYDRPNIITMFKQGTTRVPADKVPALADVLGLDRAELMQLWCREYAPELLDAFEGSMGMTLSRTERSWVVNLRKRFPGGLPPFDELVEEALAPLARKAA